MWNEGYTAEINYTYGYFAELSATRIKLALLSCGVDHSVPDDPTYLELGFGQGLTININAATSSGSYFGTDFNPGQVANAREFANAMGKQITLLEDSFEELAERDDLPQFDIIALHGIWSWISVKARAAIIEIARKSLKPGGVFYVSYNVTPGWSPGWPLRTLLSEYAKRECSGTILEKVDRSIEFVDSVIAANAAYFVHNPQLKERLNNIKKMDKTYLAHEYFNANWDPMPFSQVADMLAEAKLNFAASASILENLQGISTPGMAMPVLQAIKDPVMRETTRDYFSNQQFRRDIFVKGTRYMTVQEHAKRVERMQFTLLGAADQCPKKVPTIIGDADLKVEVYEPVVKALAASPGCTASVAELMANKALASVNREQIWEILLVLTGAGFAAPVATSKTPDKDLIAAKALNAHFLERAEANAGLDYFAAPKLGAGINISRIDQLLLRGIQLGEKDPASYVHKLLEQQGQNLVVAGEAITDAGRSQEELKKMLVDLKGPKLDLLKRLGAW